MSVSSSGSNLCRRLWIKHLCHDIVQSQHTRFISPVNKQAKRLLSQANYQSPPSFLTPTYTTSTVRNDDLSTHSRKSLEKQILEQTKGNQLDHAHRLLGQIYGLGHTPTIATYNHIMKALAKQFQHQQRRNEAHALVEDMVLRGVTPNSQTYIQLLLGYTIHTKPTGALDNLQKIQLLFDKFIQCERDRGYKRTHHKIKKVVEVMAGVGHAALLPVMTACMEANINLDVTIWNTALSGCVKGGDMNGATQLLEIMRKQLTTNATSYHTVINGYLKTQHSVDHAIELFQKMMDDGVVADYRIYQDFLCAYTTESIQDKPDKSSETLQRLWQAMMTTMTDEQKIGDPVLLTLLDYYLRHQCYSGIEQVYWDLRQRGSTFSRRSTIYFHRAIRGFAKNQHMISGITMFYDLLAEGHGTNHAAMNALLRACVLRGQLDMANQIVEVVEETTQQSASVDHYALMVQAYIQQGQLDAANKMFSKVRQMGDGQMCLLASYQAMIRGYFNQHQGNEAHSLFEQYLQYTPSNGTMDKKMVGIMVEGYGRLGETKLLDSFINRSDILLDDPATRTALIHARINLGDMDGAERDLKEGLKHTNIQSLCSSVQAVLSGLALNGNVASCEHWVDLLSSNNLMDDDSYRALVVCYGQAGNTVKLKQAYDNINQHGIKLAAGIENKIKFEWLKSDVRT